ncbi:glycine zipper domain-containing protein [Neorhodopirellula pilleata]|uniref:Glycine zipper domain-containing protein n=1 Tax=Neorhodopirellula pilleata TaxID=2714738 RepID=A0A5C6AWU2_9BACT|nr:glycine zipper domain-containing protein [Neorhodopirellula pilleata]TWU03941.1 hypothetical protein Pla100_08770 [Neorhodopirellula pilleata]
MLTVYPFRRCMAPIVVVAILATNATPAKAQHNTQRGATFGGITGAIAGAIIGENNNEAGAGAAIGGAIGAVAGGLLGNAADKDNALRQQQYYQSRQQYAAPVYAAPQPVGAVSFTDVISMSRSGVGDNVILNQIQSRGVQRQPVVSDIISLHQQGVSETVIAAMQQAPTGSQLASAPQVVAQPTIVESPVIVQPRIHTYGVPVYHGYPHRGHVYRARPSYHIHYGH